MSDFFSLDKRDVLGRLKYEAFGVLGMRMFPCCDIKSVYVVLLPWLEKKTNNNMLCHSLKFNKMDTDSVEAEKKI